jgi:hypothetical protein
MFYISAYLEANRDAYYDGLTAVSRDGDWTGWCRFFLEYPQLHAFVEPAIMMELAGYENGIDSTLDACKMEPCPLCNDT